MSPSVQRQFASKAYLLQVEKQNATMPRDDDKKSVGFGGDELEAKLSRIDSERGSERKVSALQSVATGEDKPGGESMSALQSLTQENNSPRGSESEAKSDAGEMGGAEDKEEEIPDGAVSSGWEEIWGGQQAYTFKARLSDTVATVRKSKPKKTATTQLGWQLRMHDLNIKLHSLDTSTAIKLFRAFVLIHQSWAQIVAKAFFRLRHAGVRVAPGKKDGKKPEQSVTGDKPGGEFDDDVDTQRTIDDDRNVDKDLERKLGDETNAGTETEEERRRQRHLATRREAALTNLAHMAETNLRRTSTEGGKVKVEEVSGPLMDMLNDNQHHKRLRDCQRRKEEHVRRLLEINESEGKPIREVPHNDRVKWAEKLLHINESGARGGARASLQATAVDRSDRDHIRRLQQINASGDDIKYFEPGGLKATCQWARVDNSLLIDTTADAHETRSGSHRKSVFAEYA
jgi:hypothetical protein